jgi:hypothetical protein
MNLLLKQWSAVEVVKALGTLFIKSQLKAYFEIFSNKYKYLYSQTNVSFIALL